MKTIRNWHDLEPYGIRCLTGEACGLSARALCDLTDPGVKLVREFLGLPYNAQFQDSWNSGAIASCFLPWDVLPSLAAFILITRDLCTEAVHVAQDGLYGIESGDDRNHCQEFLGNQEIVRTYRPFNGRASQTHQMSGRAQ